MTQHEPRCQGLVRHHTGCFHYSGSGYAAVQAVALAGIQNDPECPV